MIRGLTDSVRPAFPELGQLRKGAAKSGNRPGADLQYFRFTSSRPEVQAAFEAALGKEPRRVECLLPYRTVEECFDPWREAWSAGSLVHRCDGEHVVRERVAGGYVDYPPGQGPACPGGCKPMGRLRLILPDLLQAGYVGHVTLLTTSINDIAGLLASLHDLWESRAHHPLGLKGVLMVLWREPVMISTPASEGNGKRVRREKWLVRLAPAAEWVQRQLAAMRQLDALEPGEVVPMPDAVTDDGRLLDSTTGEIMGEAPAPGDDDEEDDDDEEGEVVEGQFQAAQVPGPDEPLTQRQHDYLLDLAIRCFPELSFDDAGYYLDSLALGRWGKRLDEATVAQGRDLSELLRSGKAPKPQEVEDGNGRKASKDNGGPSPVDGFEQTVLAPSKAEVTVADIPRKWSQLEEWVADTFKVGPTVAAHLVGQWRQSKPNRERILADCQDMAATCASWRRQFWAKIGAKGPVGFDGMPAEEVKRLLNVESITELYLEPVASVIVRLREARAADLAAKADDDDGAPWEGEPGADAASA